MPSGFFNWFSAFWKIPDVYALQHQSLDAYLYLRYLRIAFVLCFVGACITWPVLFPVNATGGGGQQQLNVLSYSNIDQETQKNRYYAHAFVCWAYFGFILYLIMRECIFFINLRQAFLLSPFYSERISSRTVLFTSVPTPYRDDAKLRKVFGSTVKNVWVTSNTKEVDELVKERDEVAFRLENAEVKLVKLANKIRREAIKKGASSEPGASELPVDSESGSMAARWVPNKKRPAHRLGPLGLIGKKVDTINWCRHELERLIPAAEAAQVKYRAGETAKEPGVFVEFRSQADAEGAAQILAHHQGLHMSPRYVGVRPSEIVWKSLSIPWWQLVIRRYVVLAAIAALILFWAIPVAVVGVISNVEYLKTISFLTWLDKVPQVSTPILSRGLVTMLTVLSQIIMGFISGLLPAVALSILMSLVPVVMRLCAKFYGEPSLSRVELFTQNAYFIFQVVQVFLITTMSSSAAAVAKQIADNPASVTSILANNLPKASNVYISYFIVQGLTIATSVLTQVVGFVIFTLLYKLLANTPRKLYTKWANLSAISWGSTMPVYTNIVVIGQSHPLPSVDVHGVANVLAAITYAGIAPLMLGWATIAMGLFYLAWRYNIFFVTDTQIDTRGLIYPRAIKQLFTGVYLAEVCMIGLFGASVAPGPLVLMVIFLIFTVLFHISLNNALNPLLYNLPMSLLAEEESRLLDPEAAGGVDAGPSMSHDTAVAAGNNHNEKASNGANGDGEDAVAAAKEAMLATRNPTVGGKKANFVTKFLKPWIYADYLTLRALVPRGQYLDPYGDEVARDAYFPPSVTSEAPLLWIPSDADGAGVSAQEVEHSGKVIPITDEGCVIDENGKLVWDQEGVRPPVWEEKIYY